MQADLRDFWQRFQTGVEVAVAGTTPDRLLGVRDGFLRYLHQGLQRPVPTAVVGQSVDEEGRGLWLSDARTLEQAREGALKLRHRLGDAYHFYVGTEGGLHSLELDGRTRYFVRNWTVVSGVVGEACGASGSVEIPGRLIPGLEEEETGGERMPESVPGTRRKGGLISSLTGGLENRRTAVGLSTFHALSSLFYDRLETHG